MANKLGKNPTKVHEALAPPQHGSIDLQNKSKIFDAKSGLTFVDVDEDFEEDRLRQQGATRKLFNSNNDQPSEHSSFADASNSRFEILGKDLPLSKNNNTSTSMTLPANLILTLNSSTNDSSVSSLTNLSICSDMDAGQQSSGCAQNSCSGYSSGQNEALSSVSFSDQQQSVQNDMEGKQYTCITSQKILFYLRSCLTTSFYPDYDFSEAHADEFSREPNFYWVKKHVDNTLGLCLKDYLDENLLENMWLYINEAIKTDECEIYSYNPSVASQNDPFENCLWSFAFMIYNPKLNRIFLLSCSKDDDSYDSDEHLYISDDEIEDIEHEYYDSSARCLEQTQKNQQKIAEHLFRRGYSRQRSESLSKTLAENTQKAAEMRDRDLRTSVDSSCESQDASGAGFSDYDAVDDQKFKEKELQTNSRDDTYQTQNNTRAARSRNWNTVGTSSDLRSELIKELKISNQGHQNLPIHKSRDRHRTSSSCSKLFTNSASSDNLDSTGKSCQGGHTISSKNSLSDLAEVSSSNRSSPGNGCGSGNKTMTNSTSSSNSLTFTKMASNGEMQITITAVEPGQ